VDLVAGSFPRLVSLDGFAITLQSSLSYELTRKPLSTVNSGLFAELSCPLRIIQESDDLGRQIIRITRTVQQSIRMAVNDLRNSTYRAATSGQPRAIDSRATKENVS